jgi:hypothetical protein
MRVGAMASGLISWRVSVLILAIVLASGVLQLFTGWQRRHTFTALVSYVLEGAVIVQKDGHERRTMTVTLGGSHSCPCQAHGDHG